MTRNIEYKIRIRDALRRRLETAAKKSDVSINQEMVSRLEKSFEHGDTLKLGEITADLQDLYKQFAEGVYKRFAQEQRDKLQTQELMNAAEALIRQVQDREELKPTIAWVQEAIAAITKVHGRTYDDEPWGEMINERSYPPTR